jgi:drug/metabolite transporter (DMT)-like permease
MKAFGWGLFAIFCWGTLAAAAGRALEAAHPAWVLLGAMAYLTPFLSAFFLWLILGEPVGLMAAIGMVLIVAGGVAAAWRYS